MRDDVCELCVCQSFQQRKNLLPPPPPPPLQLQLQLQSFTLKQLFSEESCSVVGLSEKMSFQLRSELSATVER